MKKKISALISKISACALTAATVIGLSLPLASAASEPRGDYIPEGYCQLVMDDNSSCINVGFESREPGKATIIVDGANEQPNEVAKLVLRDPGRNLYSIEFRHAPGLYLNNLLARQTSQPLTLHNHDFSKGLDMASLWFFRKNSNGSYTIHNAAAPHLVIDCAGNIRKCGNPFILFEENHTSAQNIFIHPITQNQPLIPDGRYVMIPKCAPNSAVETRDSSLSNGAATSIWARAFDSQGKIIPTQTVVVKNLGLNRVVLYTGHTTNKVIDVLDQSYNIAPLHQWYLPAGTTRPSVVWLVKSAPGGGVSLSNMKSGLAFDVSGASSANGTRCQQHPANGSIAQIFDFIPENQVKSPVTKQTLSNALYGINTTGSKISCGFDGYSPSGTYGSKGYRHEGIDFVYQRGVKGQPIHALCDGEITQVKTHSNGMTTIALYNRQTDLTVVYLHAQYDGSLRVGNTVTRGQRLGTENRKGADSVHTHLEVRPGRKSGAATSKDATLVNPNPGPLWAKLGYTVR